MSAKRSKSEIHRQIIEAALRAMAPYVEGWIETLGKAGAPPGKYKGAFESVQSQTRVQAAKEGMAFLGKYLDEADEAAGQQLMDELRRIGAFNVTDTGEGGDWPPDPELDSETADLE